MFKRYGIHGIMGIGGISPIFGVGVPGGEVGCTFELLAMFDVANQGYVDGQILGIPEGVDVGQLTVTELNGVVQLINNRIRMADKTNGNPQTGTGSELITKTMGKLCGNIFRQRIVSDTAFFGLNNVANLEASTSLTYGAQLSAGTVLARSGAKTPIVATVIAADYQMAFVLGGYDVNEVPWDSTQAAMDYGCAMFIKNGAFTDWTLLWRWPNANNDVYFQHQMERAGVGRWVEYDEIRVPTTDYSAVLQPTVKDTFTDANGTSLDAHTPDVSPGGVGWTERFGNWDIQGNKANVVNDGGGAPRAIATTPSNLADMFCRATGNLPGPGQIGIVFRYVDNNNFWTVMINDNTNTFTLFEFNAGVSTSRAAVGIVINPATDYEITVIVNGNDMACYLDGANRLVWTSAIHAAATVQGARGITANSTLDNFHIQPRAGYTELDECPAIAPVHPACLYHLLARWDVANQGYANGQVLGEDEGVDIGQLTVVEIDGTLAVVGNECAFTAQGTPVWGDLGIWGSALPRSLGKGILVTDYTVDAQESMIGCYDTGVSPMILANSQHIFQFRGSGLDFLLRTSNNTVLTDALGDWVASTSYDVALILGGYDNAGEPWDDTQAGANYLYGVSVFVRGGTYADWTLLWRETADNTSVFYPAFINYSSAGTLDDFRVPAVDYSAVVQPTVKDTFTDANGTSLDAHTPNVIPAGGWTEQNGDWDIQGNKANVVADGGAFPRAVATVPGLADFFGRVTTNLAAGGSAIGAAVYRYSDNNNFWMTSLSDVGNAFQIIEVNGGATAVRDTTAFVPTPGVDYEITVTADGQDMQGYLDGGNHISFSSVLHQANTIYGILGRTAGTVFDDFHTQPRAGYTELDECP